MTVLFTVLVAMVAFGERIGTVRAIATKSRRICRRSRAGQRSHRRRECRHGCALAGTLASLCYGIAAGSLTKRTLADVKPTAAAAGYVDLRCGRP